MSDTGHLLLKAVQEPGSLTLYRCDPGQASSLFLCPFLKGTSRTRCSKTGFVTSQDLARGFAVPGAEPVLGAGDLTAAACSAFLNDDVFLRLNRDAFRKDNITGITSDSREKSVFAQAWELGKGGGAPWLHSLPE